MASYLKQAIYRNESLRRAVAQLPCVWCGAEGRTQAAHIGGLAQGKGRGLKVADSHIAALCGPVVGDEGCHWRFDQGRLDYLPLGFTTRDHVGWYLISRTYILLTEQGYLKVSK